MSTQGLIQDFSAGEEGGGVSTGSHATERTTTKMMPIKNIKEHFMRGNNYPWEIRKPR